MDPEGAVGLRPPRRGPPPRRPTARPAGRRRARPAARPADDGRHRAGTCAPVARADATALVGSRIARPSTSCARARPALCLPGRRDDDSADRRRDRRRGRRSRRRRPRRLGSRCPPRSSRAIRLASPARAEIGPPPPAAAAKQFTRAPAGPRRRAPRGRGEARRAARRRAPRRRRGRRPRDAPRRSISSRARSATPPRRRTRRRRHASRGRTSGSHHRFRCPLAGKTVGRRPRAPPVDHNARTTTGRILGEGTALRPSSRARPMDRAVGRHAQARAYYYHRHTRAVVWERPGPTPAPRPTRPRLRLLDSGRPHRRRSARGSATLIRSSCSKC